MGDSSVSQKFNHTACAGVAPAPLLAKLIESDMKVVPGLAATLLVHLRHHHVGGHSLAGIVLVMLPRR